MFTRTRHVKRQDGTVSDCHQLLESYRGEDGKPRHRVLASWTGSKDIPEAITEHEAVLADLTAELRKYEAMLPAATHGGGCGAPSIGFVNRRLAEIRPVYQNARKRLAALKRGHRLQQQTESRP